jgi:hypothetical protein
MTYREYGQWFAYTDLISEAKKVQEGSTVEIDYKTPNGIEVSKVGTVTNVDRVESSIDFDVRTGGPRNAYLHVNTETGDVFFAPDSFKRGETRLLMLDVKDD